MKRSLVFVLLLMLLPITIQAYTLVLKDGRRIEVRNEYRIVNNIAVFSLPEGNRFSLLLEKIDINATELANGQGTGDFTTNVTEPTKITDTKSNQSAKDEENPIVTTARPAKKLTNGDFERYRIRREQMARASAERRKEAMLNKEETAPSPLTFNGLDTPVLTETIKPVSPIARKLELEKKDEEYWRGRSREILTQIRVLEQQITMIEAQINETQRNVAQSPNVSVYTPPPTYPGVIVGGIPIPIGAPRTSGGSVVIVRDNPNQQRGQSLQSRLTDLQLQYQETLIRYEDLREEARKAGALPGWLR